MLVRIPMLRDLDLDQLSIARDQPRENEEKELAEEEAKAEKELCYRAGCIKSFSMPGYLTGLTKIR